MLRAAIYYIIEQFIVPLTKSLRAFYNRQISFTYYMKTTFRVRNLLTTQKRKPNASEILTFSSGLGGASRFTISRLFKKDRSTHFTKDEINVWDNQCKFLLSWRLQSKLIGFKQGMRVMRFHRVFYAVRFQWNLSFNNEPTPAI